MTETADLSDAVNFGAFLLENSAENHLVEHFAQKLFVEFFNCGKLRFAAFLIFGLGFFDIDHVGDNFFRFLRFRRSGFVASVVRSFRFFRVCFLASCCFCRQNFSFEFKSQKLIKIKI